MTDPIKAEPVAWVYELAGARFTNLDGSKTYTNWRRSITNVAPNVPVDGLRNLTPLYTHAQLVEARRLAWNEAIEVAADWFADRFSDAVQADCESGVKWLNERAAKAYLKDAPDTLAAIREGEEAIRALTKDSTHD